MRHKSSSFNNVSNSSEFIFSDVLQSDFNSFISKLFFISSIDVFKFG